MCFGGSKPAPVTPEPAAPPAPSIPMSQSASAAQAASPSQQIGFARKSENRKRYGKTSGPKTRRDDATTAPATTGDTGAGIKM
jgi:hypothetical protein